MTPRDVVSRALEFVGAPIGYGLGSGGLDPHSPTPAGPDGKCDCSGFASWSVGDPRYQPSVGFLARINGGWLNTTAMVRDAKALGLGLFDEVAEGDARPSDLWAYPKVPGTRSVGHCGVIVDTRHGRPTRVVHCSRMHPAGRSIQETGPERFERAGDAVVIRHIKFGAEPPAWAGCPCGGVCCCHEGALTA